MSQGSLGRGDPKVLHILLFPKRTVPQLLTCSWSSKGEKVQMWNTGE